MSQRQSGYERKEADVYETPAWVTHALCGQLDLASKRILEPACGSGQMVQALMDRGHLSVAGYDIRYMGQNFLERQSARDFEAIVTNPPYELAREFCEHALDLMEPVRGMVAMLLRTDFDHAVSRSHLFGDHPAFAKKLVLTKRIAWFVEANGKPKASPSFNHAWYIWNWKHIGPPTISYGPERGVSEQPVNIGTASHADLFTHPQRVARTPGGTGTTPAGESRADDRAVANTSGGYPS